MIKALLFDWGDTLMIDFSDQKGPMYTWSRIEAVKNAKECLLQLSKVYPCYIATNAKDSTKEDIYKALHIVGIGTYIRDIFCFKEIGYEKPGADFFNTIFDKLALFPNEIAMIGDDLDKDFNGSIKNGINGILFDPKNNYSNIKQRITDLLDIADIVKSL
jgi:putative hydrolase of the HAD superfamily